MKRLLCIAIIFSLPSPARADNCSGLNDCQNQVAVWAAIIGGLIIAGILLWWALPFIVEALGETAILGEIAGEEGTAIASAELATEAEVGGEILAGETGVSGEVAGAEGTSATELTNEAGLEGEISEGSDTLSESQATDHSFETDEIPPSNRAQLERFKDQLASEQIKPTGIQNEELSNLFDNAYREGAEIGNGSTASAAEQELISGEPVKGRWHIQKSLDQMRQLDKWLKNNANAPMTDIQAAENYLRQLKNLDWDAAKNMFPYLF